MNIWIFNHYATAPGNPGGTRHYDLSRYLAANGHSVTIFASSFNHQSLSETVQFEENSNIESASYANVKFIWVKSRSYKKNGIDRILNMLSYSWRSYVHGKRLIDKPDVIIGSLVHPMAALVGYMLARKKGCLFYFEERDLWPQTLIDLGKISKYNPFILLLSWLEKFLYKKSKRIIVLFDKAVNYVTSRGVDAQKVLYLPNGVDLSRYQEHSELPESLIESLVPLSGKFIAIYLGTHGKANNLDSILDAAKKLVNEENIHFLCVGDGPEKNRLMQRTRDENIRNITFLNAIPKEWVPALLKRAHVGLLPLVDSPVFKWGISPNKLFDYMATGLPVILLCNLDGTPVENSGGGIVVKDNFSDKLAEGIVRLYNNPEQTRNMGLRARKYVQEYHSWENLSKQLILTIEQDLGNKEKSKRF
jgi:glycosyltransferase involved in cell wall biosynthesis